MPVPLIKFHSDDPGLNTFQTNLQKTLSPLIENPITDGTLLQNVPLGTGTTLVAHRLGRKLVGWIITRIRSAAVIYDTQDANNLQDSYLSLVSDSDVVVDLYCF